MVTDKEDQAQKVIHANIRYHEALAPNYDSTQPHYKPENVGRVEKVLADLSMKTGGDSLLDLGCGTGFIINIAKKYFKHVTGVDITPSMLERVDKSGGQIELYQCDTGEIPLEANQFDVCTAYGFLHHLYDLRPTLQEAYRCLKPGGIFFSGQDPNYYYWWLMNSLKGNSSLEGIVRREFHSVVSVDEDIAANNELQPEDVALAEFQKVVKGGFDVDKISDLMKDIGFQSIHPHYEWFLGQGKVIHQQSQEDSNIIENFLRETLPASKHLFKYVSFFAQKAY